MRRYPPRFPTIRAGHGLTCLPKRHHVDEVNQLPQLGFTKVLDMRVCPDVQNQVFEFFEISDHASETLRRGAVAVNAANGINHSCSLSLIE